MRKLTTLALSLAALAALVALGSGTDALNRSLPGGLPLGNVLALVLLLAPAVVACRLSRPGSLCRRASTLATFAAAAWLPVSILLAGNLNLDFTGTRGEAWVWLTLVTAVLVLVTLTWAMAGLARRRWLTSA